MAENQPLSIADSIGEARERLASELRLQGEQIQKLNLELAELQSLHERAELESARQWDAVADAAELAAAAKSQVSPDRVLENILGAIRGLITCTIPEQVMRTLTEEAAQWGVRAAIFDVRGRSAWGASAHGFGPSLTENAFRSLIVQLSQDNPFRQVCETAGDVEASAETLKKNRNVLDKLKPSPEARVLLLPIRSAGTVTAIFYADPGESGESLPVSALKILAEFAGAQIDRLIALSGGFAEAGSAATIEEPAESESLSPVAPSEVTEGGAPPAEIPADEIAGVAAHAAEPQVADLAAAEPAAEPSAAEVHREVEVAETSAPVTEPSAAVAEAHVETAAPPEPAGTEVPPPVMESQGRAMDPHSAITSEFPAPFAEIDDQIVPRPVESIPQSPEAVQPVSESETAASTPVQVADALDSPSIVSPSLPNVEEESVAPPAPAVPIPFDLSQLSEVEQKIHKDAKRFAKLLVSEIELYNKAKVAEGRKNWDLYKRLKADIDRSRLTFEKRFGKVLSRQVDYFHDELVKILALNDAEVLGPGYPGPSA